MKVTPTHTRFMRHDPGEVFDLKDGLARAFIRAGKLAEAPTYQAKVMDPEPTSAEPEISAVTGRPKRQYRRRDLTAEE